MSENDVWSRTILYHPFFPLRLVLRAVTYNNLGCFYKSMNKLHTSLQYLKKALVIEERALAQDVTSKDRKLAVIEERALAQDVTSRDRK